MKKPTTKAVEAALALMRIIGEAIKEAGPDGIPNGHLYNAVQGHVPLAAYQQIIELLKRAGAVTEKYEKLIWINKEV